MRLILVLALLVALSGCRTQGFVSQDMDSQRFFQDYVECEAATTPKWQFCWGQMCQVQQRQIKRHRVHCMGAKGWRLSRSKEAFRP